MVKMQAIQKRKGKTKIPRSQFHYLEMITWYFGEILSGYSLCQQHVCVVLHSQNSLPLCHLVTVCRCVPIFPFNDYQISSVAQSCLTLCNPMDCRTPGSLVHHQLPELAQTQIYQASDAIQPSHPLLSPSPPAFNRCYFIQIMLLYLYIISIFPNLRQCFR